MPSYPMSSFKLKMYQNRCRSGLDCPARRWGGELTTLRRAPNRLGSGEGHSTTPSPYPSAFDPFGVSRGGPVSPGGPRTPDGRGIYNISVDFLQTRSWWWRTCCTSGATRCTRNPAASRSIFDDLMSSNRNKLHRFAHRPVSSKIFRGCFKRLLLCYESWCILSLRNASVVSSSLAPLIF